MRDEFFGVTGADYHEGDHYRTRLAFAAAIDLTYLGGIERGRRNPSLMVMARIADALGVPLPRLLSD